MKQYKNGIAVLIGAILGFLIVLKIRKQMNLPEVALERAKNMFQAGTITGSWIVMEKETMTKDGQEIQVYKGGLTHLVNDSSYEYRFIADANNAEIIEMNLYNQSEQDKPLA